MTRDELVAQIQLLMGFRTDLGNIIKAQINIQQAAMELASSRWLARPWFLQTERANTTLVVNDERLLYPADWLADLEDDGLWITDADGKEHLLPKDDLDVLRSQYINSEATRPQGYAQDGNYYRLFPKPDQAYVVRQQYYKKDVLLSDAVTENEWSVHAPDCLIGRAGMFLCGASNSAMREMFSALYEECKSGVEHKSFEIQTTNRQYAMGENQ